MSDAEKVVDANSPLTDIAQALVYDYVIEHLDPSDGHIFLIDDVYIVSFNFILGDWKAMLSTTLPDGMYYELTFDGRRGVAYLDPYKRFDHKEIAIPVAERRV